jgi:GNAT superfamily N-acetyltransferase
MIHAFLRESYWASGIPFDVVQRSVEHSLPFGLYEDGRQIGFARVITDYATFAYIGDIVVVPSHRGQGLGKWLVEVIMEHPRLQGLRRWILATADAHGLYEQYGFTGLARPEDYMEKRDPDVYGR